jgi:hypothetical protein
LRLRARGLEIIRNPIPFGTTISNVRRRPRLYNNIIVENRLRGSNERPLVWLPHFADLEDLHLFDEANAKIWRDLGFEIVPVYGWGCFSDACGALRCATKVLKRGAL